MIIDGHIHYSLPVRYSDIKKMLEYTHSDKINLVALYDKKHASETLDCLMAKDESKGRLYVYGALDITVYIKGKNVGESQAKHVEELMKCGCDGIKMLEGKPTSRKRYPILNFDDPDFDAYFDYLEKNEIRVVWHVNDPEEFWDDEKCPDWAKRSGWFYDQSYVNNEDQYRQIYNVLMKHPNLHIHFAHFYFLSAQLPRLADLFDHCPNIGVDITPGIELFVNLSNNLEKAKEFFIKYQDRIQYGTDISGYQNGGDDPFDRKDSLVRVALCKDFLEKDHVFLAGDPDSLLGKDDLNINGLALDKKIVDKIMGGNFERENGKPKPINKEEIFKEIEREKERIDFLANHYDFQPDYCNLNTVKEYFENKK